MKADFAEGRGSPVRSGRASGQAGGAAAKLAEGSCVLWQWNPNAPERATLDPSLPWLALPDDLDLQRELGATLVKSGAGRSTWRAQHRGTEIYVKLFLGRRRLLHRARGLLFECEAIREFRNACRAEQLGVPMVRAIAAGVERGGRRCVLITRGVPEAITLAQGWPLRVAPQNGPGRRVTACDLLDPVARLFARAHDLGFVHLDGHPNNVLVHPTESGSFEALFADAHPVRFHAKRLKIGHGAASLAQLDQGGRWFATRSERLRCLRCYLVYRRTAGAAMSRAELERSWVWAVASRRKRLHSRLAGHRDRRLHGDGKHFLRVRIDHSTAGMVVGKLGRRNAFPEPLVQDRDARDWASLLGTRDPERQGIQLVWHSPGGWAERLRWTVCGSPPRNRFMKCHKLRHRDCATSLVLGYLEERRSGLIRRAAEIIAVDSGKSEESGAEPIGVAGPRR